MGSTVTYSLSSYAERLSSLSNVQKLALLLFAVWAISGLFQKRKKVPNAPIHGYRSILEPKFVLQARFNTDALNIISSGYKKVSRIIIACYPYIPSNIIYLVERKTICGQS